MLTVSLEPLTGSITRFYAFVNNEKKIAADGDKKREWTGRVTDGTVKIKIRVIGIGDAEYNLGLDLPGTANDQSITLKLEGGYHETEISI